MAFAQPVFHKILENNIGRNIGTMHLIVCDGLRCIPIFLGLNSSKQWFPRGVDNQVIMPQTQCVSSGVKACSNPHQKCILTLAPSVVKNAVMEVMNKAVLK